MNSRQAAKAAAKHIEEMEYAISRYVIDVKAYNACILDIIQGGSPCKYCEEYNECQLEAKDGKGCSEWWLKDIPPAKDEEGSVEDESKGLLLTGSAGGE